MIDLYLNFLHDYPLLSSAVQVAILGMFGELLAIKIRSGKWRLFGPWQTVAKISIWAFLGISFKYAFAGFHGFVDELIRNPKVVWFSQAGPDGNIWIRALSVSLFTNMLFGPVMMLFHRWTDNYIEKKEMDWNSLQKAWLTLLWFWIPAHTLTFACPAHLQVSLAAVWAVALGVILGYFARSKAKAA